MGIKRRFSDEQIIAIRREGSTEPTKAEVCRKQSILEWTFSRWPRHDQGMELNGLGAADPREQENAGLTQLVAEQARGQQLRRKSVTLAQQHQRHGYRSSA